MSIKNGVITACIVAAIVLCSSVVGGMLLEKKVKNATVVYRGDKAPNTEQNEASKEENKGASQEEETIPTIGSVTENKKEKQTDTMSLCLLGEIMMGGEVTEQSNDAYTSPFKNIYANTNTADFTYANFSTNIVNLDTIKNAKSKYLVTNKVVSGLSALGLDAVSIASDHMIDFDADILKNTITNLESNDIFVAGRQNTPVYFEKGDKKIAIVSTNAVILGTAKNYTKNDISIYEKDNLIKNIKEAKQSADIVIADIHWGKEYTYGVTEQMRQIASIAVDNGADMVIGSHAVGVYPMELYHGKPILYSLGYLIGDSDLYVGKESFIFDVEISKEKKISKITMTPTYIKDKKEVLKFSEYNLEEATTYLQQFNSWQQQNGLNSSIEDKKIVVTF